MVFGERGQQGREKRKIMRKEEEIRDPQRTTVEISTISTELHADLLFAQS